ncbi:MAG: DUF4783 domain-containing protein [Dinghuibacter sp.]|nr:DUF4783 domain-containing protein [Dinghuibacter sp.]
MKKFLHFAGFLLTTAVLVSFTFIEPIDEVMAALRSGNANALSKYFDNTVEISLPDRSNAYSKTQAEVVMKDFFQTKTVRTFDKDYMSNNGNSIFCIGTLSTKSGNYRTTIHMKTRADRQLLQEIRIEDKR